MSTKRTLTAIKKEPMNNIKVINDNTESGRTTRNIATGFTVRIFSFNPARGAFRARVYLGVTLVTDDVVKSTYAAAEKAARKVIAERDPSKVMTLHLRGAGNPDLGQYADISNPKVIEVTDFKDAIVKALAYRDHWNLGGGNFIANLTKNGCQVAYISYNGRVWDAAGKELV